jgi:hypothetical protein
MKVANLNRDSSIAVDLSMNLFLEPQKFAFALKPNPARRATSVYILFQIS